MLVVEVSKEPLSRISARPGTAVLAAVPEMILLPKLAVPLAAVTEPRTETGPPIVLVLPVPGLKFTCPATETLPEVTLPETCVWLVPSKVTLLVAAFTMPTFTAVSLLRLMMRPSPAIFTAATSMFALLAEPS